VSVAEIERIHRALTSVRHEWSYRVGVPCPPTVGAAIKVALPHLTPAAIAARFSEGGIYVNGIRVTTDQPISPPVKLELFEPKNTAPPPELTPTAVVFEDDDLLAVVKPCGLPAMPARDQLEANLKRLLERRNGAPIHMPSRLDTSTSGLVVVSKTPRAHPHLQRVFEHRRVKKTYLAEVTGALPFTDRTIDAPIGRDPAHQVLRRVVSTGGKAAVTHVRALKFAVHEAGLHDSSPTDPTPTTLIAAEPVTGRTHQIRVHTAHLGAPIVGDNFYGGAPAPELHLLCFRLVFTHPIANTPLVLTVPASLVPAWAVPVTDIA
jgi:23S rRNA pseudouridine1911/1915/1917 synthase